MRERVSGPVLVVDDDPYVLESVATLLSVSGFEVHPFTNGLEALAELRRLSPYVVLTDVNMPHITGIELLEKIHEMDRSMSRETIERLTAAAELRDEDTGLHISRIGFYAKRISEVLGMPHDFVETIALAAAMHDVGKIGAYRTPSCSSAAHSPRRNSTS